LTCFPNHSHAYYVLGLIAKSENKLEEAKDHFLKSCRFNESNIFPLLDLAELELQEGNLSKAKKCYQAVLKIQNNHPEANKKLAEIGNN
jgi:tetratricopeptide (TPR) repeat protein